MHAAGGRARSSSWKIPDDGVLLRPAKAFKPSSLDEVVGRLRYKGKPKTLNSTDAAIAAGVKARRARGRY